MIAPPRITRSPIAHAARYLRVAHRGRSTLLLDVVHGGLDGVARLVAVGGVGADEGDYFVADALFLFVS